MIRWMRTRRIGTVLCAVVLSLSACSSPPVITTAGPGAGTAVGGSPEDVVRTAFVAFAKQQGVPYRNEKFSLLSNDGAFAVFKVTVEFRRSAQTDWQEYDSRSETRKVGGAWQTPLSFAFQPSTAEVARQQEIAAATARAQAEAQAKASAAAELARQRLPSLISLQPTSAYGFENYDEGKGVFCSTFYFSQAVDNGDSKAHQLLIRYKATYVAGTKPVAMESDQKLDVPAGSSSWKISVDEPSHTYCHVRWSNLQLSAGSILTIDGYPTADPATAVSKLSVTGRTIGLTNHPIYVRTSMLRCQIRLSSGDSVNHQVTIQAEYDGTYRRLGDAVTEHKQTSYVASDTNSPVVTIPPASSADVVLGLTVSGSPDEVTGVGNVRLTLQLTDAGANFVPQEKAQVTVSLAGCSYSK